ncbi:MAG: prepilin-type N-terminal cleavage/methylation domain-containing protein [Alphaproteobacteria bacterium]|uniref:Prepilin-type N-terminal cleavage/methylation domain-containing protein n=1 Tax=Candidatus Nitrobium versatile TaxID=2884831 RepID=A0A953J7E8_9BACT|nr:prepilin-type N-terminal cleavage/methylation domain-containing protein [Candidatus Nitrobium versatile]
MRQSEAERGSGKRSFLCHCGRNEAISEEGFTLLELLVVIFIVALVTAVVFPTLRLPGGGGLNAEAKRIASVLRYLNDTALAAKEECVLKIDFREDTLSWKGPDFDRSEKFSTLAGVEIPSRGEIREGEVTLFFDALGGKESITVTLRDEGETRKIVFNPLSGRVRISEGEEGKKS